jgi:heavy metal efflux system protein
MEVGHPVVSAVAIIMIVYLSNLSLMGIEGKMFKPMALTLVFALLGSLILLLIFPAALIFLLRGYISEKESFVMRYARRRYRPAPAKVTGKRRPALVAAIALVVVSGAIFPSIWLFYLPSGA